MCLRNTIDKKCLLLLGICKSRSLSVSHLMHANTYTVLFHCIGIHLCMAVTESVILRGHTTNDFLYRL